ncbi:hypothetical protein T440DRAFT_399921 [Plenodomus tracheiphilus IPT5]|uniref:Uncharacterized protein n=1 Tax=Plenodomus tracheiphilus IPT5 TaxID=1408161 RepID=A0A6A7B435_9PLEO|nr:hypothetical protein T440DRAFT_399921 [Plenodomus tracheiphilus IPT5]
MAIATPTPTFTSPSTNGTTYPQTPASSTSAPANSGIALNVTQLRLMHHYTTITATTLAHNREAEEVFATTLVELAFDHPYLLHAAFAITALHMYHLKDPNSPLKLEYWILAERHHDAGLNVFQSMVTDIDSSNFKPVLLFANILFPYSCVASVTAGKDLEHAFESVLSNLYLTRRTRPMVSSFYTEMKESELGRMVPDDVRDIDWEAELPVDTELVQLRKFAEVVHHVYPPDIVDAYGYAIHVLEQIFVVAGNNSKPPSDALPKLWIHFVSDRYMELLSERQPGSLIIFAHFAVMLHRSEHYWFMLGVAEQILKIADALVPNEWKSWLDWPKQQIHGISTPELTPSGPST